MCGRWPTHSDRGIRMRRIALTVVLVLSSVLAAVPPYLFVMLTQYTPFNKLYFRDIMHRMVRAAIPG